MTAETFTVTSLNIATMVFISFAVGVGFGFYMCDSLTNTIRKGVQRGLDKAFKETK